MALDSVTPVLRLKDVKYTSQLCDTAQLLAGILQCNGGKLEEAEDITSDILFTVC